MGTAPSVLPPPSPPHPTSLSGALQHPPHELPSTKPSSVLTCCLSYDPQGGRRDSPALEWAWLCGWPAAPAPSRRREWQRRLKAVAAPPGLWPFLFHQSCWSLQIVP